VAVEPALKLGATTHVDSEESIDDLTKIEGIGPKIAEVLRSAGLRTFSDVAEAGSERITEVLAHAGVNLSMHNPGTWPEQARLAGAGDWQQLKQWQDILDGGINRGTDDLTKIEGIGPQIADALLAAGIRKYEDLATNTPEKISEILDSADGSFAGHNPATWPEQAKLAASGQWDRLRQWQDELQGGV